MGCPLKFLEPSELHNDCCDLRAIVNTKVLQLLSLDLEIEPFLCSVRSHTDALHSVIPTAQQPLKAGKIIVRGPDVYNDMDLSRVCSISTPRHENSLREKCASASTASRSISFALTSISISRLLLRKSLATYCAANHRRWSLALVISRSLLENWVNKNNIQFHSRLGIAYQTMWFR